jgi:tryptophan synthase beta chain
MKKQAAPAAGNPELLALEEQLRADPDDRVARVRLLELHFKQGNEQEFLREATLFRNGLKGNLETADWKAVQSIGLRLFPGSPLFADAGAPAAAGAGAAHRRLGEDKKAKPHFELLAQSYGQLRDDPKFLNDLDRELLFVASRPSPLLHARRLSQHLGGAQIYLKREDVAPAGSRLQIHVVGQALLAQRLGKTTLVTGTVYGQRGVIMAETAARLGLKAVVYMDQEQIAREPANVFRMWLTGADVQGTDVGKLRGRDIREVALKHWLDNLKESMLVLGLDHGPEPYPLMAREFSAVIGRECRRQMLGLTRAPPDVIVARAGDNADAIGLFQPFLPEPKVRLVCVEGRRDLPGPGAGPGLPGPELSADQRRLSDAILEGLEYPSVTREHRWLKASGRVEYSRIGDEGARETISLMSHLEGLVPAIETAHAIAWACGEARRMKPTQTIVVAIYERADKDILKIGRSMGVPL